MSSDGGATAVPNATQPPTDNATPVSGEATQVPPVIGATAVPVVNESCGLAPTAKTRVATSLRVGPDSQYDEILALNVKFSLEVLGRYSYAPWWYVEVLNGTGQRGWVADADLDLTGFGGYLPELSAPALNGAVPTPGAIWQPPLPQADCTCQLLPEAQAFRDPVTVYSQPDTVSDPLTVIRYLSLQRVIGRFTQGPWWLIQLDNGTQGWVLNEAVNVYGHTNLVTAYDTSHLGANAPAAGAAFAPTPYPGCNAIPATPNAPLTVIESPPPTDEPAPESEESVAPTATTVIATLTDDPTATPQPDPTDTEVAEPTEVTEDAATVGEPATPNPTSAIADADGNGVNQEGETSGTPSNSGNLPAPVDATDDNGDDGGGGSALLLVGGVGLIGAAGAAYWLLGRNSADDDEPLDDAL